MTPLLAVIGMALLCALGHVAPDVQGHQSEMGPRFSVHDVAKRSSRDAKIFGNVGEALPGGDTVVSGANSSFIEALSSPARSAVVVADVNCLKVKQGH